MKRPHYVLVFIIILSTSISLCAQEDVISKSAIKNAEKIIGLEFTNTEIDSMHRSLISSLEDYKVIRKINLPNSIPPAIGFNPIPVGFNLDDVNSEVIISDYSNTEFPADKENLAFYSIGQLAELVKTQKITSVELTKFFIQRLKKYDPILECVVSLTEDLALEQAASADQEISEGKYKGPLHGIPYGAKDLLSTKNYKTTWGAVPYKDQIIDEDATVIKKLKEAGAVLVAKLTMGALAWGDVWFGGKTKNPWDISQGSSGSSAGPASATSAGLVPFAIGTETWGSIVSPSTVCGVSGLRPTYGRVSRIGAMALSWSMDKIGPICRNAEDLAIVFNSIYGPDEIDQTLYDFPFNYSQKIDFRDLKIGYLKSEFDKEYPFHKNDSLILKTLRSLGADLIPIDLPNVPVENISFMLSAEAAAAFDELTRTNKDDLLVRQIKNAWPNVFRSARFIPAVEYINANRVRYLLIQEMAELMKNVDLYIAPSWEGDNLLLTNLTGHPCVVVPNGFSQNGTPTSISFIGRLFEEGKIIAAAKAFQDATDFHLKHPTME
jgi:Asp-tRNA(Asn)/Glu-tRNA(Gln) amidotransferase A subunit family amidase